MVAVDKRPELSALISRLELVGPLSACGFYNVDRGLLVPLTGTLLTYIIILIQMLNFTTTNSSP